MELWCYHMQIMPQNNAVFNNGPKNLIDSHVGARTERSEAWDLIMVNCIKFFFFQSDLYSGKNSKEKLQQ